MSPAKEYRELQFKSSQLAAVFIGVLIVGVLIFILGVSVGKKQGRLAAAAGLPAAEKIESVAPAKPLPREAETPAAKLQTEVKPDPDAAPAGKAGLTTKPAEAKPPAAKPAPVPAKAGSYFVQASATNDKAAAAAFAARLEKEGFDVVVLDPFPTDAKPYFRVRVGPFAGKEEADAARTKLATLLRRRPSDFFLIKV
jgi:cell division protein FtsN